MASHRSAVSRRPHPPPPQCSDGEDMQPVRVDTVGDAAEQMKSALRRYEQPTLALLHGCRVAVPADERERERWIEHAVRHAFMPAASRKVAKRLGRTLTTADARAAFESLGVLDGATIAQLFALRAAKKWPAWAERSWEKWKQHASPAQPYHGYLALQAAQDLAELLLAMPFPLIMPIIPACCFPHGSDPLQIAAVHPDVRGVSLHEFFSAYRRLKAASALLPPPPPPPPPSRRAPVRLDPAMFVAGMLFGIEFELQHSEFDICSDGASDSAASEFVAGVNRATAAALGQLTPPTTLIVENDSDDVPVHWQLHYDGSVDGCMEIVSPPLSAIGSEKVPRGSGSGVSARGSGRDRARMRRELRVVEDYDAGTPREHTAAVIVATMLTQSLTDGGRHTISADSSAGMHVHVSFDANHAAGAAGSSIAYVLALVMEWQRIHPALLRFLPRDRDNCTYCKAPSPVSAEKYGALIPLVADSPWDDASLYVDLLNYDDRFQSLNLEALLDHGTFEVRLHHGCVDPTRAVMWALLMCSVAATVMCRVVSAYTSGPAALRAYLDEAHGAQGRPLSVDELIGRYAGSSATLRSFWLDTKSRGTESRGTDAQHASAARERAVHLHALVAAEMHRAAGRRAPLRMTPPTASSRKQTSTDAGVSNGQSTHHARAVGTPRRTYSRRS